MWRRKIRQELLLYGIEYHRAINGVWVFLEISGIEFRWSSKSNLDSLPDELAEI